VALVVIRGDVLLKKGGVVCKGVLYRGWLLRILHIQLPLKHPYGSPRTEYILEPCDQHSVSPPTSPPPLAPLHHLTRIPIDYRYAQEGLLTQHVMHLDHLSSLPNSSHDIRTCIVLYLSLHVTGLPAVGASRHVSIGFVSEQFI